jgi:uncharacterized metal-binding protein
MAECACGGDGEVKLLYACSGMANTGMLADQVWRKLARAGVGSGTCLAAIGAGISGYVLSAQNATRNIVFDGCKVACGAKIFEKAGIPFEHYVMTDYDVEKGRTPITGDLIEAVSERIEGLINERAKA